MTYTKNIPKVIIIKLRSVVTTGRVNIVMWSKIMVLIKFCDFFVLKNQKICLCIIVFGGLIFFLLIVTHMMCRLIHRYGMTLGAHLKLGRPNFDLIWKLGRPNLKLDRSNFLGRPNFVF